MSNKKKMFILTIMCILFFVLFGAAIGIDGGKELTLFELIVVLGAFVYVLIKWITALNYWTVALLGEDIKISGYDYEMKVKYNKVLRYYSVRPVVTFGDKKFKGLAFWEFNKDFLNKDKEVLSCKKLGKDLIIL